MKIRFIKKLALLIFFASLFSGCVKKYTEEEQEKNMDFNSYTEHVVKNHLLIRNQLKPYVDSIELYARQGSFIENMGHVTLSVDTIINNNNQLVPQSHKDSLVYAMSQRLIVNYGDMVHRDFAEIFFMLDQNSLSKEILQHKVDSIKSQYRENDRIAVKYFNQYLDSVKTPLQPFY